MSDRERAAWHEAGHVAARMLGIRVCSVDIVPDDEALGRTHVCYPRWSRTAPMEDPTPHREGMIDRYAIMTLAGSVAEARVTGQPNWEAARGDLNDLGGVNDSIEVWGVGDKAGLNAAFACLLYRAEQLFAHPEVARSRPSPPPCLHARSCGRTRSRRSGGRRWTPWIPVMPVCQRRWLLMQPADTANTTQRRMSRRDEDAPGGVARQIQEI